MSYTYNILLVSLEKGREAATVILLVGILHTKVYNLAKNTNTYHLGMLIAGVSHSMSVSP